jgi:hypothetical protein
MMEADPRERFAGQEWPSEVEFIVSALEAAGGKWADRRSAVRVPYRVRAELRLYSDMPGAEPWLLFTRDVCPRSLGFITPHRLPLGYGGILEIPGPDGQMLRLDCTLLRCREASAGWYEGALYFNRDQWTFVEHGKKAHKPRKKPEGLRLAE